MITMITMITAKELLDASVPMRGLAERESRPSLCIVCKERTRARIARSNRRHDRCALCIEEGRTA